MKTIRAVTLWAAAILLGLLPFALGLDYGGILAWTQYVAALVVLVIVLLVLAGSLGDPQRLGIRQHMLLLPLGLWAAYAWFQSVSLPPSIVAWLSPGSVEAYTTWIDPFLDEAERPGQFPISLAAFQSRHAAAMILVLCGVAWATASVAQTRSKISWLLSAIAIGAAIHAGLGVVGLLDPKLLNDLLGRETSGPWFGGFVNRNNAALLLNLGIATGLGILSWRLTALTGTEVDEDAFEFNDLIALMSDRESMIGVVSIVTCVGGLLVGGSRGGVVAAVVGAMLALGWVRRRRGLVSLPVVIMVLAVSAAILLVPTNLSLESIRRMELLSDDSQSTWLRNGRLEHWPDGWRAAVAHLPAGSGLSTYAYAYLPHQQTTPGPWFHHADNLWLELIVEQGVIGILLALAVLLLVIRSLARLGHSPDPIDQGLRITGWYVIGAILVSQCFDFGLILPANLVAVTILFTAILARDNAVGIAVVAEDYSDSEPSPADSPPQTEATDVTHEGIEEATNDDREILPPLRRRSRLPFSIPARLRGPLRYAPAVAALVAVTLPLSTLRDDAWAEWVCYEFDARWDSIKADPDELAEWDSTLRERIAGSPRPDFSRRLADLAHQRARLTEVQASRPRTDREFADRYRRTAPAERTRERLSQGAKPLPDGCGNDPHGYGEVLAAISPGLSRLPLDPAGRRMQIHLDFVHCDPQRTVRAIEQLHTFYLNSPPRLIQLGTYAAARGEAALAIELWRRALDQSPTHTTRVANILRETPGIDPLEVFPETEQVFQIAGQFELRQSAPDEKVMAKAVESIQCGDNSTPQELGDCQQLKADLCYRLGRIEEALQHHTEALKREPRNVQRRLALIRKLIDHNKLDEARELAREGRTVVPDETKRFDALITEIAEIEKAAIRDGR